MHFERREISDFEEITEFMETVWQNLRRRLNIFPLKWMEIASNQFKCEHLKK